MYESAHNFTHTRAPPSLPLPLPLTLPTSTAVNSYATFNMSSDMPSPTPSMTPKGMVEYYATLPDPPPVSRIWEGKAWALEVVQQPIRARMCGFGDKDRRPISPPPCIRLIIFDPETHQEINYASVTDLSRLVLNVDLWSDDGSREDNCVRHTPNAVAIAAGSLSSYPPVEASPTQRQIPPAFTGGIPYSTHNFPSPITATPSSTNSYFPNDAQSPYGNGGNGEQRFAARTPSISMDRPTNGFNAPPFTPGFPGNGPLQSLEQMRSNQSARSSQDHGHQKAPPPTDAQMTHVAKNLIGSASSSAFKLADENGVVGLWFVLQDLSVRTEGHFRLKMNFFNLSAFTFTDTESKATSENGELLVEAPCLATVFSKVFHVYSAKKFPGVIETTPLSRQFAKQGIKIPIRKDGNTRKRKADDEDDDDSDEDDS